MFGSSEEVTGMESTWEERLWGAYTRGAWAAFARDPEGGLEGYGWKRYDEGNASLALLGLENHTMPVFESAEKWDAGCSPVVH